MLRRRVLVFIAAVIPSIIAAVPLTPARCDAIEPPQAGCSCTFTGRKDYNAFQEGKNFWGKRKVYRKWFCIYSCDAGRGPENVSGTYELTNTGEDSGLEGICEGTVYES